MDFDEALARTINLLERQGFASYRLLQRRFHLDDAMLAAVTAELVDTQQLAADEDGRRLVWLGALRPGSGPTRLDDDAPVVVVPRPASLPGHRAWTPLVGRETEVARLHEGWAPVQAGQGQVVLLSGDAGMGKSRLVQVLKAHAATGPHRRWECRCDPYFQHSAFYPMIDLFQRGFHLQPEEAPAAKLPKLEAALTPFAVPLPEVVPLLASLLSIPVDERYPLPSLTPAQQKQRTLEAIWTLLQAVAVQEPVLFIMEDLHWADPSTLELLTLLLERVPTTRCALLLTYRPEFQAPWPHPVHSTVLTVGRLLPVQVEVLATQVAGGKALPAEVLVQIVARTEGVPLFVEEVTQMLLTSGLLREEATAYALTEPLPPLAIPPTVQASLEARLASLGQRAQLVAQVVAVWGRAATEAQLLATVPLERLRLERALARLVAADILHELSQPPRLTYVFKHALIQEVAYASMPDDVRRTTHGQVAQFVVEHMPETVQTQPNLLAQHFTAAELPEQALPLWHQAGQQALQRSANQEAIQHLTQGLALLEALPETPARTQRELDLQMALGPALMAAKGLGAPEVEGTYTRARALCQQMNEEPRLFPVLWGLWRFYFTRAIFQRARELAEQLLTLAQRQEDPTLLLPAHQALGSILYMMGEFALAREHLEQGIAIAALEHHRTLAVQYGISPGVLCFTYASRTLWSLGYPAQALQRCHEVQVLAQELVHAHSQAFALYEIASLNQRCREVHATREHAEALIRLATEHRLAAQWMAAGNSLQGWVLAFQGRGEEGLGQIRQGMAAILATGAEVFRAYFLILLAEACGHLGRSDEGLRLLAEAQAAVDESGQRYYEAETYRLKGELLLQRAIPDTTQAEACFQQALAIARSQQAKSWELRAAISLARLRQHQGKPQAAHALLAPVYGWFTEGFDTADLQEARTLLEELV